MTDVSCKVRISLHGPSFSFLPNKFLRMFVSQMADGSKISLHFIKWMCFLLKELKIFGEFLSSLPQHRQQATLRAHRNVPSGWGFMVIRRFGSLRLGWGWDVQSAVTCRRRSLPMIYYCSSSNPATGVRVHGQLAPKFLNLNGHGEGETIGLCPSELPRIQCAGAWTVKFCVYFYLIKVKFLHNKKQLYDSKALHDPLAIVSLSAFTS